MAQLTYRTGSFVSAGNASGQSLSLTKPTGTADGDRVCILVYYEPDTNTVSVSGGPWETVAVANTGAFRLDFFTRIAASEPASYTITDTASGNQWRGAAGVAYSSGTGTGTQIDVSNTVQADGLNGPAVTVPSVTTTGANRLVVVGFGDFGGTDPTGATGFAPTLRGSLGGTALFDGPKATAGATGTTTITVGGTVDYAGTIAALISDLGGAASWAFPPFAPRVPVQIA